MPESYHTDAQASTPSPAHETPSGFFGRFKDGDRCGLAFLYQEVNESFLPVMLHSSAILTRSEAEDLISAIRRSYDLITPQQIERINQAEALRVYHEVQKYLEHPQEADIPAPVIGYVYLLKSQHGLYKIGKTLDPESRIAAMGVQLPFEIELEHLIKCDDHSIAERLLHDRYAAKRGRGEWFALTPEDVTEIKLIKRMKVAK